MILEPRFLEKPAFAVEQSRNAARKWQKNPTMHCLQH